MEAHSRRLIEPGDVAGGDAAWRGRRPPCRGWARASPNPFFPANGAQNSPGNASSLLSAQRPSVSPRPERGPATPAWVIGAGHPQAVATGSGMGP